jgi:type IV secretory pathway VirB4 component
METPRNKMINTKDENTKNGASNAGSLGKEVKSPKISFWYPTLQMTIVADSQEEADKKAQEFINNKNKQ